MSKRLDVLFAVKNLIKIAIPGVQILGLDADEDAPTRIPDTGRIIVRAGDPGDADIDLSPLFYWYEHRIPVEVAVYERNGRTSEAMLDDMLGAIGKAIERDRYLGDLCIWLEAEAPSTENIASGGETGMSDLARAADLIIVASYGTNNPLT